MAENILEEIKVLVLHKRNKTLDKVRDYINNFLNPSKINFYEPILDDLIEVKSVSKVLEELSITEQEYENALKISDVNSYQLHFDDLLIHALSIISLIYVCLHGRQLSKARG